MIAVRCHNSTGPFWDVNLFYSFFDVVAMRNKDNLISEMEACGSRTRYSNPFYSFTAWVDLLFL